MDLYAAQRTNFKPSMPRLAMEPGSQRQTFLRSANRGKKSFAPVSMNETQQLLMKLARFNQGGA